MNNSEKHLFDLLKLLTHPNADSKTIIQHIETHRININTYLPLITGSNTINLPLIYYCCSNVRLIDLFKYLLSRKVDLCAPMHANTPSDIIELLYYAQPQYIPVLIQLGCQLKPTGIIINATKLIIKGNITKLMILHEHKAIAREQLLQIIHQPNLLFRVLDNLYERLFQVCQTVQIESKQRQMTAELIKNYCNVFKLFFKNGITANQIEHDESLIQRVLNTYLVDLIKVVLIYHHDFDNVELLHYSNFELTNRQVLSGFYNDATYNLIKDLLKDHLLPKKINIKKPNRC